MWAQICHEQVWTAERKRRWSELHGGKPAPKDDASKKHIDAYRGLTENAVS